MFGKKSSESLLNQSGRSFVAETMQIEGEFHFSGAVDVAGFYFFHFTMSLDMLI